MIKKRGELSTEQIVLMIILIASFIVILFFLFNLKLGKQSEKEVCHNSVMTKASALSSSVTPLNCYRKYICITEDGTCEELVKPEVVKVKNTDEIYKQLADEMADCWWMFGEGKVAYMGTELVHYNYCSICSQILFDDSLKNIEEIENGKLSKDKLYDYLSLHYVSSESNLSYIEYIFRTGDLNNLKTQIENHENNSDKIATFGNIEIGKQYFVVMGITSEVSVWKWAAVGTGTGLGLGEAGKATVNIASFFGSKMSKNPIGAIVQVAIIAISAGAGTISSYIEPEIGAIVIEGDGIDNKFMAPTIQEANSEKFKALNCEDIVTFN